jgi:hypothetical protein
VRFFRRWVVSEHGKERNIELDWRPAPKGESLEAYYANYTMPLDFGVRSYNLRIEKHPSDNNPRIFWWHVMVDDGNTDSMRFEHGHDRGDAEEKALRLLEGFLEEEEQ